MRVARRARSGARMQCGAKGASTAASGEFNASIVNGQPASQCEWIWQVSLQDSIGHFCGGMLIDPQWVLTAAHCLGGDMNVRAGHYYFNDNGGQLIRVAQQIEHPSYSSSSNDYDIALLRMESPFQMNSCVGLICLPQQDVAPGTTCWTTGWGALGSGLGGPNRLQEVAVQTLSNTDCQNTGYSNSQIRPSMICAQGSNSQGITDACQGDSGGPLACQAGGVWNIYGATSWGNGCALPEYPGVWARVHYVLSWIESYVGGGAPSPPRRRSSPPRRRSAPSPPSSTEFVIAPEGSNTCPSGYSKLTEPECAAAASSLGYDYQGARSDPYYPTKCWLTHRNKIRFNTDSGSTSWGGDRHIICGKSGGSAPTPSGGCPSAYSSGPDPDYGDCACNPGLTCYEGALLACPYNGTDFSESFFWPDCYDCVCK